MDSAVAQTRFGPTNISGAGPVAAVDNSRSAVITIPDNISFPAISVSGGGWPRETVGSPTALGATPQVTTRQLQTSADDAAKLASGISVEMLVKAGWSAP